jgi:hypothetical protein
MLGVDVVGTRHKFLIPAGVSSLIAANQKNGNPARIESKKASGGLRSLCDSVVNSSNLYTPPIRVVTS